MPALNPSLFVAFTSTSGGAELGPGVSDAKYPRTGVLPVLGSFFIQVMSIRVCPHLGCWGPAEPTDR